MATAKQLECRVIITRGSLTFSLGMWDPLNMKYAPLGNHKYRDMDKVVRDLKERIEREGHLVTFSDVTGER